MIIDSHCHVGKGDCLTDPANTSASLKNYLQQAQWAGINKTILLPALNNTYHNLNKKIAAITLRWPQKFVGFGMIHPVNDRGNEKDVIEKIVKEYNLSGLKIHKYDGHINRQICSEAAKYNLPILYDVMGDVAHVELLAQEFPKVNFIIPHLGSFADDWKAQQYFIHILAQYPNIYTDTSGVRRFELLMRAYKSAGPNKIIFGSDGPWLNPEVELFKIKAMRLSKDHLQMILSQNIQSLMAQVKRLV